MGVRSRIKEFIFRIATGMGLLGSFLFAQWRLQVGWLFSWFLGLGVRDAPRAGGRGLANLTASHRTAGFASKYLVLTIDLDRETCDIDIGRHALVRSTDRTS